MSHSDSSERSTKGLGSKSSRQLSSSSSGFMSIEEGVVMEMIPDVREDSIKELAKIDLPWKSGYRWVSPVVTGQFSLFTWSRLLDPWLRSVRMFERGTSPDIVSLERVSTIENVRHGQEQHKKGFFYIYMCPFHNCIYDFPLMTLIWVFYIC